MLAATKGALITAVFPFRAATLVTPQAMSGKPDPAALKAVLQKAVNLKAAEVKAAAARAAAPPSIINAPDLGAEPAWAQAGRDCLAASEATFAKWETGEEAFAADHGYRREVNSGLLGKYAHAMTGDFGTAAINTRKDMNGHLDRFIQGFISDVALTNRSGGGSLTVGDALQGYVEKGLDERGTAVFPARSQDHLDARRMTLYAKTAYVRKSVGPLQPIVIEQDVQVRFTEQTITLQGKPFPRIGTDGGLSPLAANSDLTNPDPVDPPPL